MSAFLTHLAVGALLGLALRLRLRYIPVAALLAEVHDIDHFDQFLGWSFVESRVTLHNVWFTIALPLAVFGVLYWRKAKPELLHLAAAAPLLMTSHLLLDILPFEAFGSVSRLPLFWPLLDTWYTLPLVEVRRIDPREYSTITILLVTLIALTVFTIVATHHLMKQAESARAASPAAPPRSRARRHAAPFAFAAVWILLTPGLAAAGFLVPPPNYANAALSLVDARLEFPQNRLAATVYHNGGASLAPGALTVDLVGKGGELLARGRNPERLDIGDTWNVLVTLPDDARSKGGYTAYLNASNGNVTYARAPLAVVKSHLDLDVRVAQLEHDGRGNAFLTIRNAGQVPVPAKALLVHAQPQGGALANLTNALTLQPGDTETLRFNLPLQQALQEVGLRILARDDMHEYLSESRQAELRGPLGAVLG